MTALPRPTMVVVDDFAVAPDAVRVDTGLGGTARRILSGTDISAERARTIAAVRDAARDSLIQAIVGMNLPARSPALGAAATPFVEIRGTLLSINEGNQTRRNVIGFGAGESSVTATVQIIYVAPGAAPLVLESLNADSDSGRMPGLAVGGAGAAAGHVAAAAASGGEKVATAGHADTDVEARNMAQGLAAKIGALFAQQGWIPASAVPSSGL
jgi:hypothetical protein